MTTTKARAAVVGLAVILLAGCGTMPPVKEPARNQRPVAIKQVRPKYPLHMRRAGIQGDVLVSFTVTTTGDVENARAMRPAVNGTGLEPVPPRRAAIPVREAPRELTEAERSDPEIASRELAARLRAESAATPPEDEDFGTAAVIAVQQWKFQPAMLDGKPIAFPMTVSLVFTLNEP